MTPQEILDYNRRCALFLGAIDNTHSWGFMLRPNELNLSFDLFDKKIFSNDGGSSWFIKDLKFHQDWNWIMEVVEAIEKIESADFYMEWFWLNRKNIALYQRGKHNGITLWKYIARFMDTKTKKEAVIQTINNFLIWYNDEHTNKF